MKYTVRPISDRTWLRPTSQRKPSPFDSTWTKTLTLLGREVDALGGKDVVIEVDVPERAIRLDGMLRADARATLPAAVVAFGSTHGPMLYRCDRYESRWADYPAWQQNVRAIALTLESLRAVDRYGATETGQQYAGFKALPAGRAMPTSHMTTGEARDLLAELVDINATAVDVDDAVLVRRARAITHPDRHAGDQALWDQVEQAARVLGVTR